MGRVALSPIDNDGGKDIAFLTPKSNNQAQPGQGKAKMTNQGKVTKIAVPQKLKLEDFNFIHGDAAWGKCKRIEGKKT